MPSRPHGPPRRAPRPAPAAAPVGPLDDAELDTLQARLDAVPAPLEPLDLAMVDGLLCAVLVQPAPPPPERWLPFVTDIDGRPLPKGFDAAPLHALVLRRHAELAAAIAERRWFDPWVLEVESGDEDEWSEEEAVHAAVYPWVAGFATGFETFPGLAQAADEEDLLEPLALLYRHLDADDIEDDAALRVAIDAEEPAADLADAVEGLVRATLLLADLAAPDAAPPATRPPRRPSRR
ncbi:MAG TPA: YecA family protein [Caldimonas sp.]|jgi:uncharacterized protein|nr:YecA family protein [Caldimonas sp.]HEX2543135.1 YecA family protein [Caldimonas sp.]